MKVFYADFTDRLVASEFDCLHAAGIETVLADPQCLDEETLITYAQGFPVIVCSRAPMSRRVMEKLPDLRLICAPQVGTDHIDVTAARDLGILVAHTPYANYTEVAVHALAMALMLIRQIPKLQAHTSIGGWKFRTAGVLKRPAAMTLGIVGVGRIGCAFAERAAPCFGRKIAFDPYVSEANWPTAVERVSSLQALLSESDIVSLHVPLTDETAGMISADFLGQMKLGSFLVNVSRGGIADTKAILAALDSNQIAGAGLDVLPQEPPQPNDPILTHPKVVLTPHSAFFSEQSQQDQRGMTVENILEFQTTGVVKYPLNDDRGN